MKQMLASYRNLFFRQDLTLRAKIFNVLATSGVLLCAATAVIAVVQGLYVSMAVSAVTGVISAVLLVYSARGGNQKFCYIATVVCVFLLLFPSLFFTGGGYSGAMGICFVLAVVYTVYMLDGRAMFVTTLFELVYYSGICVFAYLYPAAVTPFASEYDRLIDVIVGFIVVSTALGLTMYVQLRMHQKQQKELEAAMSAAEIASEAKSTFLANMSHEIRTPIHVIMSINELIRTGTNDIRMKAYNDKIGDACELLRGLVDNILDMSRIEAGKTELRVSPYRTSELKRMLELVGQSRCSSKQLEFRCVAKKMPNVLCGDVEHIRQIVINLLSNAVKYTEKGTVTLVLSCDKGEGTGDVILRIAVTDTGIGIEPDTVPLLFETFTRADRPGNRYIEGTGLGLAIVRELCRLMHGSIHVESQIGWGSTFTVSIPQTVGEDMDVVDTGTEHFIAPDGRILVVDDNPENLSVMRELLRHTQLHVDIAVSGKEALDAVRKKKYHVILLDYMMPEMDGMETMQALRETEGFDTPVIALTANAIAGTRDLLLSAGFSEYLTKPIPWGRLSALLREYLPAELVTVTVTDAELSHAAEIFCEEFQSRLKPYGIDLHSALPLFDGDPEEYLRTANIFLAHGEDGCRMLEAFLCGQEDGNLLYSAHALKGRAKHLGLFALAQEAERIEMLCRGGEEEEAQSLLPHLLYLYRQAMEGLWKLAPKMEELLRPAAAPDDMRTTADDRRELQKYLDGLQRAPALACIDALLSEHPTDTEHDYLLRMRRAVTFIRFDEASAIYVDYIRGGNTWTLEAES